MDIKKNEFVEILNTLIVNQELVLAHIDNKDNKKSETLLEHSLLAYDYMKLIIKQRALCPIFERMQIHINIYEEMQGFFNLMCEEMREYSILFHDLGKINPNFQLSKLNNKHFIYGTGPNKEHSLLSALLFIDYFYKKYVDKIETEADTQVFCFLVIVHAYCISRHHSSLGELEDFKDRLIGLLNEIKEQPSLLGALQEKLKVNVRIIEVIIKTTFSYMNQFKEWKSIGIIAYSRLIESLIISADYFATSEYISGLKMNDFGIIKDIEVWQKSYDQSVVKQSISKYATSSTHNRMSKIIKQKKTDACILDFFNIKDINVLRSELFLEASCSIRENLNTKNIFYLEAPTGSGKTNTSIQLFLDVLKYDSSIQKVFYVFPFNTLAEQTIRVLNDSFSNLNDFSDQCVMVNSITPIHMSKMMSSKVTISQEESLDLEEQAYSQTVLDSQFFNYPLVITSHVQFFDILFSEKREKVGAFFQLANSVIVLDEIQSYRNEIWKEIILFLNEYAALLNLKVIIMSATLPRLGELIYNQAIGMDEETYNVTYPLLKNYELYYGHPLFKDRVKTDYSFLDIDKEMLKEKIFLKIKDLDAEKGKDILVEFIKKKTAKGFFEDIISFGKQFGLKKKIYLLTGDDNKYIRENIVKKIKNKDLRSIEEKEEGIILITTQIIEAGVDIDMDYGFKDVSILDSEEQFMGRINRSCKKDYECTVFFFNLDDASTIYKKDCRTQTSYTLVDQHMQNILKNKRFEEYYALIMKEISTLNRRQQEKINLEFFERESIKSLSFKDIDHRMRLIVEDIFPCSVFINHECSYLDIEDEYGNKIDMNGEKIWLDFKEIIKNKDMSYAQRKIKLSQLMPLMSCFMWKVKNSNFDYDECIGDIYYISNGEKHLKNGQFDRLSLDNTDFEII